MPEEALTITISDEYRYIFAGQELKSESRSRTEYRIYQRM